MINGSTTAAAGHTRGLLGPAGGCTSARSSLVLRRTRGGPSRADLSDVLRIPGAHIADPAPLGLAAFALTTACSAPSTPAGCRQRSSPSSSASPSPTAASAQFAAGMWEFARATPSAPPRSTSYGAFWISFWWLTGHTRGSQGPGGRRRQGARSLPAGLGHLHRLHDRRRHEGQRRRARRFRPVDDDVPGPGLGRIRRPPTRIHQDRRVPRAAHRFRGLVRVVRRRHGVHAAAGALVPH